MLLLDLALSVGSCCHSSRSEFHDRFRRDRGHGGCGSGWSVVVVGGGSGGDCCCRDCCSVKTVSQTACCAPCILWVSRLEAI